MCTSSSSSSEDPLPRPIKLGSREAASSGSSSFDSSALPRPQQQLSQCRKRQMPFLGNLRKSHKTPV